MHSDWFPERSVQFDIRTAKMDRSRTVFEKMLKRNLAKILA